MKLKYLLPFLFFLGIPRVSEAQFKAEANPNYLDVKSAYADISLRNPFGLENLVNTRGDIQLKYGNNALYLVRNGLLNHTYGGNIDLGLIEFYHNRSEQSDRDETREVQDSPIGKIITETTILDDSRSRDFGFALNYRNFFASYESATQENKIDGSTLITIGEDQDLVPFSSGFNSESTVYGIGFRNGFFKFIQNRHQNRGDGEEQPEERFNNYLINANYSFGGAERERVNLNVYYGEDISGFFNFNLFRNINLNLIYDRGEDDFTANLSTHNYSRLNHRDFERHLENGLRAVSRIYDSNLETTRRYLNDMFFTKPFSYDFSISLNEGEVTANLNLNLRNVLFHYSRESQAIGLRYKFMIGEYDFRQDEARFGVFFGRQRD
ncbi:MAG: hypothetical protein AABX50_00670 [Nanoarchaeota archaeon]